jgi:hypothetical protein
VEFCTGLWSLSLADRHGCELDQPWSLIRWPDKYGAVLSTLFGKRVHKQLLKPDKPDKPLPPRMGQEKERSTVSALRAEGNALSGLRPLDPSCQSPLAGRLSRQPRSCR